jgi:hypothetical protein
MTVCLDTGVFLQTIAAEADFVVTEDNHFAELKSAGFRPQPLAPDEFIRLHLAAE